MPVTSTRRISTSSSSGLQPFIGSSPSASTGGVSSLIGGSGGTSVTYRRSIALSPSRFGTTSGTGYYRSLSSNPSNYYSNRNSIAYLESRSNESSRYTPKYPTTSGGGGGGGGDGGYGDTRSRSGLLGSRASIARSVATSGADLYEKYSPAYFKNQNELSRSRSVVDNQKQLKTSTNSLSNLSLSNNINNNNNSHSKTLPSSSSSRASAQDYNNNLNGTSSLSRLNRYNYENDRNNNNNNNGDTTDENDNVRGSTSNNNNSVGLSGGRKLGGYKTTAAAASGGLEGGSGSKVTAINGHQVANISDSGVASVLCDDPSVLLPSPPSSRQYTAATNTSVSTHHYPNANCNQKSNSNNVTKITITNHTAADTANAGHINIHTSVISNNNKISKNNIINNNSNHNNNNNSISSGSGGMVKNIISNKSCTSNNRAIIHVFGDNDNKAPDNRMNGDAERSWYSNNVHNNSISINSHHDNSKPNNPTSLIGSNQRKQMTNGRSNAQHPHYQQNGDQLTGKATAISTGTSAPIILRIKSDAGTVKKEHDHKATGMLKLRGTDSFLKTECDAVRNELMMQTRDDVTKQGGTRLKIVENGHAENGGVYKTELQTITDSILKGYKRYNENRDSEQMEVDSQSDATLVNGPGTSSAPSSSSSSSMSLMDTSESNGVGRQKRLDDDIKFIDSDDNNDASSVLTANGRTEGNGRALHSSTGGSSRLSKFNRTISSTLDSLKTATPIVTALKFNNHHNGHHTLPHNYSTAAAAAAAAAAATSKNQKYSTLTNLPSRARMALHNGLSSDTKSYSDDSIRTGSKTIVSDEIREHEMVIKQNMDVLVTSSEPPNDKLTGKSWEVNNGSITGIRSSSQRNALPSVSAAGSWERDRPRYRELLDAEPSTSASFTLNKYDAYDRNSSDSSEGLCGLRNIGNTCFMNSVLQCLSHTADLTKFLRSQRDPKSVTKDQRIFAEFVKLIKDMWSANTQSVTPSELKSAFASKHRMYSGCGQQDSQEFLRFFLDALHSACNDGTKQEGKQLDDNLSDSRKADLMWDWYSKTEKSVIKDLFVGQLKSTLKCTVCGNKSVTFDPFWDLSVPLPSSSRCKLENCLELFIREEVLDGDEMPTCSKCKTRRKSTKSFTIQRFPKYMVIHLKRFSETRWSKMTNVVEFPIGERELNLSPYASESAATPPNYSLYAISNHMGSTAGGHYVALCKHPQTRKWHEFNDNHVSESSESSLISSSAYLLFYERA